MSNLRKTVRNLHRQGTEAHAVVELAAGEFATVRLSGGGARYTNLPVIGRVETGDNVIVDFSLVDRPYVRPETVNEDVVVQEYLLKAQETVDPPLIDIFYSSTVGGWGKNLWNGVRLPGWFYAEYNYPPPEGWYEIDFDESADTSEPGPWNAAVDVAQYGYNEWELWYMDQQDKIPGATLVGQSYTSGAIDQQVLIRTTFWLAEEHGLPGSAILRYDYDDRLYGMYLNGTLIAGPDMTAEPGPGKPNGPWEIQVAHLLVAGKNVIAAWGEEGVWSIWPWNHKMQCIMWKLTTDLKSQVTDVLQEESISTIRTADTGTSLAPYGTGEYIPSFDSVEWGDEAYLESNPASIPLIGLTAGNSHVYLGTVLGKYIVSVQFNVQVPDAASYPRTDLDLYIYVVWSYPGASGWSRSDMAYASRRLWIPNATATVPVTFSGHFAVSEPNSFIFPRIVRGATPTNEPDTLVISDLKFDVMKIATISDSPRSTYDSHWDEWYEKYPEEL
jgi:hypothetical protein